MCALAILGLMTGTITVMCYEAREKGIDAMNLRELREAADTVFRRVLYEDGNQRMWTDGQTGTLDYYYGDFAQLRGPARDRWQSYGMEYHRKARTVAGSAPSTQSEPLFGAGIGTSGSRTRTTGTGTTGTGTTGSGTTGTGTGTDGESSSSEMVWQITLTFYRVDDRENPLLTLQTFLPPQVSEAGTGTGTDGPAGTPR
jgi:hypothetical protein